METEIFLKLQFWKKADKKACFVGAQKPGIFAVKGRKNPQVPQAASLRAQKPQEVSQNQPGFGKAPTIEFIMLVYTCQIKK
ncbi:MAG: hypothetical protein LBG57_12295 [Treponema sp.]|nr:hypothetical protein [Treponema sp.]